jgi:hypothetical protein
MFVQTGYSVEKDSVEIVNQLLYLNLVIPASCPHSGGLAVESRESFFGENCRKTVEGRIPNKSE